MEIYDELSDSNALRRIASVTYAFRSGRIKLCFFMRAARRSIKKFKRAERDRRRAASSVVEFKSNISSKFQLVFTAEI